MAFITITDYMYSLICIIMVWIIIMAWWFPIVMLDYYIEIHYHSIR